MSRVKAPIVSFVFDEASGIRERLFLLAVIADPHDSANWSYNTHSDEWHSAEGSCVKVRWEGAESLERLARKGFDRATSMAMIGYPERER